MKKLNQLTVVILALTVVILALTVVGIAQGVGVGSQPAQPQPSAQQPAQPTATTTSSQPAAPVIKDPAEYNSYMAAIGMSSPQQKAAALEQFLQQYPNTAVKKDALQQLLGAYQQAGNMQKAVEAAGNLLQVDPSNVYALFVEAFINLGCTQTQANAQCAANAVKYGQQGLQALSSFAQPQGMNTDQYDKLKAAMTSTFHTAWGSGALSQKDYPTAQRELGAAAESSPNDLAVIYPLATAYLGPKPQNPLGFWYGARAIGLAPTPQAKQQITHYVQTSYDNFHGGDDGFADLLQKAQASPNPPPDFKVTQMTPAVQAQNIYNQGGGDCKKLDLGSWEFIFQNGDQQLADKCMADIKGTPFAFQAKTIEASTTRVMVAATEDDINSNTADAEVMLTKPVTASGVAKAGEMLKVRATPTSYDKQPYMMHMDSGVFVSATKKTAPARRATRRRRSTASQ